MGIICRYYDFPIDMEPDAIAEKINEGYHLDTQSDKKWSDDIVFDATRNFKDRGDVISYIEDTDCLPQNIAMEYSRAIKWELIPECKQKETDTYKNIIDKLNILDEQKYKLQSTSFFAHTQDEYVTCPHCHSQFHKKEYMENKIYKHEYFVYMSDYCPVCGNAMIPDDEKKRREQLNYEYVKLIHRLEFERNRIERKVTETGQYWLVRVEYQFPGTYNEYVY